MRPALFGMLVLALVGMAGAGSYDTVLYTDDPTADIRMYGEVWPQYQADSVDIILTYTFELENGTWAFDSKIVQNVSRVAVASGPNIARLRGGGG